MKKSARIALVIAVIAAVGAGLVRAGFFSREDPNVIRLSGNLELTQVDMSFKMSGRLVTLHAEEGSQVAKGALIARIDQASTLRQKEREQAGLESARAQLTQSLTAVRLQKANLEGDLRLKRADVENADAHLAELLAGSRPQEIQTAQAQVRDAATWRDQARADWDRAQILFRNEDISRAQYDQFKAKFESTTQALRQAQERLALVKEGPRKETIAAARAQLERAKAALQLAEANQIELKRREQEITVRRAEIERAKAGISIIDTQLDDTTITSPLDGVVLVKSAEPGEVVAAGATVCTIGDLAHPWLRAYISEKDLGRVKLGAKVKLSTDSFPGKTYIGKVSYIASEAEFTPKQIQTQDERVKLVYRIKIDVANPNQELKGNMPADAEIGL
ncbi:MAG: HlyD family efflux transporter periplasmic adaptor subunit [Bryobacterales bacterium]|nr:HlyD family efflux transporter periplasmic adaptor subunit [Bryobacterales bacterium]